MINSNTPATVEATPVASRRPGATPGDTSGGRPVAWAGFVFGTILSVAMNWLHTWIPPQGAPATWKPALAPQIMSAVWPLCLLLAVEVLSRVHWKQGAAWALARYGGVGTVAAGSAVISYGHVHDVLASWGYNTAQATMGPLVMDGLMIACGLALLNTPDQKPTHSAPACPESKQNPVPVTATRYDTQATPVLEAATEGDSTGDSRRHPGDTESDSRRDTQIRALYQAGASTREIGREYGLHHSRIARIVAQGDTQATAVSPEVAANGQKHANGSSN